MALAGLLRHWAVCGALGACEAVPCCRPHRRPGQDGSRPSRPPTARFWRLPAAARAGGSRNPPPLVAPQATSPPTSQVHEGLSSLPGQPLVAYDLPAQACRTFRLASDDCHRPAAAPSVEQGAACPFPLGTGSGRGAGTLARCPGGVLRSIGQSAAPCQNQNGTFRGASWYVSHKYLSTVRCSPHMEWLYFLRQARCMTVSCPA